MAKTTGREKKKRGLLSFEKCQHPHYFFTVFRCILHTCWEIFSRITMNWSGKLAFLKKRFSVRYSKRTRRVARRSVHVNREDTIIL